jgi:hypothetical protein
MSARHCRGQADPDSPGELTDGRRARGGDMRHGQGEDPEPGQVVEAHEDERADPGRQQPRGQHHARRAATDTRRLQQQERSR